MKRILWFLFVIWIVLFLCPLLSFSFAAEDLVSLVKKIKPSIVAIYTYNDKGIGLMQGSGFFISPQGDVITNWHVVEGAYSAIIKATDGNSYQITKVLGGDKESDLALLSVDTRKIPVQFLPIVSSPPEVGERVMVMGNPLALEFSVSDGIVAAIRTIPEYTKGNVIQITAPVSPGSSGSPVVNMQGEVVAVAFYVYFKGENLNFAIPGEKVAQLTKGPHQTPPSIITTATTSDFKTFTDTQKGFTLKYPNSWTSTIQTLMNQEVVAFLAPTDNPQDVFRENLNILIENLPSEMSLQNYFSLTMDQLKTFPDVQFRENYDATISGQPGKVLVYSRTLDGKELTYSQVYIIRGIKAYVLTFTAESTQYSHYQPEFQQILSRFHFDG
ncbi:MAG: trypsin-like peptidase domain-containing protein [Candidatus Atribacteria bacterium]|nr:trypsin-like peptidase domain-containing protein [Candidatus Atribacteria bacterium]